MNTDKLSPTPWRANQWQDDRFEYAWEVLDANDKPVVSIVREHDAKAMAALPELIAACVLLTELGNLDYAVEAAKNALRGMMG